MSQRPPEEKLSGTLFQSLANVASHLGGLSAGFTLAGIASLVLGAVLVVFLPDLDTYGFIVLIIGGVLLATAVFASYRTVSGAVTGRRGRYTTNTAIMVIAFVGIVAVANFVAFENRADVRMDVTSTKQFSLSPRTEELLDSLEGNIDAKAFFGPAGSPQEEAVQSQIDDLLHEFKVRSDKFDYEFVDPDLNPLTTRDYEVTRYGTIVFEAVDSKKRHQVLPSSTLEQDFVTGILIITGTEQKQVYFLTGHGERDISNVQLGTDGFGIAHDGILRENYAVSPRHLLNSCSQFEPGCESRETGKERLEKDLEDPEKPKVNMIIVAGPKTDLLPGEEEILDWYLSNGGNMLFLAEPDTPQSFRDFLAKWGVKVGDGHIVDQERSLDESNEITVLFEDQYISRIPQEDLDTILQVSKVTNGLSPTFYPGLTSLAPVEDDSVVFFPTLSNPDQEQEDQVIPTVFGAALALTSTDSWLVTDPGRNEPRQGDLRGPFFPAVAIRALAPVGGELPASREDIHVTSLIVIGDSDFATNQWFSGAGAGSNSDLFLNSVNWLVGDAPLANIRPRQVAFRPLVLTRNEENFMQYSSWFLLPAVMAVMGGFVWWRRR